MYAQVSTVAFEGIDARPVDVQVMLSPGLPAFHVVGLGDKAVAESRERVRAALTAIGLGLPSKRITVNLAPADLPKEGTHYDLPIAVGIMAATKAISQESVSGYVIIGELGLDGALAGAAGVLPAAVGAAAIGKGLLCPACCGPEAAWASQDMAILAPGHLLELINHIKGSSLLSRPSPNLQPASSASLDIRDVRGQESAKRALEIAAAGGHHMLMIGPPGSGKSMLSQRLSSLLPALEPTELLEVAMIQSLAGVIENGALTDRRPFRAPHHSSSTAAIIGGGSRPKPGEVALAHNGVLFLDEFPEFSTHTLDALRQPLETGETVIARVHHRIRYPSRFQLVAAMNPCRCGHAWTPGHSCRLGSRCEEAYRGRISGPIWDRLDIQIAVAPVKISDLALPPATETSEDIANRVSAARRVQHQRYQSVTQQTGLVNARCPVALIDDVCQLDGNGRHLLDRVANSGSFSARSYHRTLRLSRTIADLDGYKSISSMHLAEALALRGVQANKLAA